MSRIPIKANSVDPATGNAVAGVAVTIKNSLTATNVTVYAAQSGGSTISNPITTDSNGRYFCWVDRGPIQLDYAGAGITAFSEWAGDLADASDIVTALPTTSLVDGQTALFQNAAMATDGIVWQFRYRAGGGTYKWEFIGGTPLFNEVTTGEARSANTYGALTTAGPSIALPLAGDYLVEVRFGSNTANASEVGAAMSYDIGGTGAVDADAAWNQTQAPGYNTSVARVRRKNALTAVTLTAKYKSPSSVSVTFNDRVMLVTPIRVTG